jgi:tRNA G18 (ribose-2'-O)-methylase SpoU
LFTARIYHREFPWQAARAAAVAISMADEIDSLNISEAAAVFLYEVNRRRENG